MADNANGEIKRDQGVELVLRIVAHYWLVILAGVLFIAIQPVLLADWWWSWSPPRR